MTPPVVEVVARYQGRVVDVQHVRWAEPAALTAPALLGAGAVLCAAGLLLALRGSGVGLVLLTPGVVVLALAHLRWRDRPRTRYVIGEGTGVDLTVGLERGPQGEAFPLVVALERGVVLGLPSGARGRIEAESPIDVAEAVAQGRRSLSLPEGGRARVEVGALTFEIHTVEPAVLERRRWEVDRLSWLSQVGAAAVLGGLFLSLETTTEIDLEPAVERFERVARYLEAIEPKPEPERPERPPVVREVPRRRSIEDAPQLSPEAAPPKLSPDASPEEIQRVADAAAVRGLLKRSAARSKDGKVSEYDYDRVAGVLGDPEFVEAVDSFTMTGRAGMIAYAGGPEDDARWEQLTQGPVSMARHFGGLELAKTERGGGESRERPEPTAGKPVVWTELEKPPPTKLSAKEEARIRRFLKIDIDPPSLQAGAGMEAGGLHEYAREHVEGLRTCYEDALDDRGDLSGVAKLVVRFDAEGKVLEARFAYTTLSIGEIEPCLLKAVRRWRPRPAESKPSAAVIQLRFRSYMR